MFFSTVCVSFKAFKRVIQKLEDPKKQLEFVNPKKIVEILQSPKIIQKFSNTEKKKIMKFQTQKIGRAQLICIIKSLHKIKSLQKRAYQFLQNDYSSLCKELSKMQGKTTKCKNISTFLFSVHNIISLDFMSKYI